MTSCALSKEAKQLFGRDEARRFGQHGTTRNRFIFARTGWGLLSRLRENL